MSSSKNYMMPTRPHAYQMKISRGPFSYEKEMGRLFRHRCDPDAPCRYSVPQRGKFFLEVVDDER